MFIAVILICFLDKLVLHFIVIFQAKINNKMNKVKYAHEAFKYLCLVKAVLTPRMAHKLKWGRFFSHSGGHGNNIECDLRVEHEVRTLKHLFNEMGGSLNEENAQRVARSMNNTDKVIGNLHKECVVTPQSSNHSTVQSDDDILLMVNELQTTQVFSEIPGRRHHAFPEHSRSPLSHLDMAVVLKWMKTLIKKFSRLQKLGPA